jgi:hypothetical protein
VVEREDGRVEDESTWVWGLGGKEDVKLLIKRATGVSKRRD